MLSIRYCYPCIYCLCPSRSHITGCQVQEKQHHSQYFILQDSKIQTGVDISVLILFIMHILLYFDQKCYQILKNPYARIWKKIVTVEFVYDVLTLILAVYAVSIVKKSLAERVVEVIFYFKIYKLIKFDSKAMYFVIGTQFYVVYKVVRTLLIVFMAIAFVGSLFYGVAYLLYTNDVYVNMLWIVSCPAIQNCVDQPFIIQLQYAMYWALGTASTAAYGDISATQPTVVLVNILALAFQGFLFGFYLNSMHSIPLQNKKKQADLLHKFDSFQQHSSNRKLDNRLYLQILCSLQYTQSQKHSLQSIQKVIPHKYIQQIKYNMYSEFLNKQQFFHYKNSEEISLNPTVVRTQFPNQRNLQQQFLFSMADIVQQSICQIHEDAYDYKNITHNHLLFVKQGSVNYSISTSNDQMENIGTVRVQAGQCFGIYGFYTGIRIPEKAICTNYSVIYSISRQKFKQCLKKQQKLRFFQKMAKCISFTERLLLREPIFNFLQFLTLNSSQALHHIYDKQKFFEKLQVRLKQEVTFSSLKSRNENIRLPLKSSKIMIAKTGFRNQETQTQQLFEDNLLNFLDSYDEQYDMHLLSLEIGYDRDRTYSKSISEMNMNMRQQQQIIHLGKRQISALQIQIP